MTLADTEVAPRPAPPYQIVSLLISVNNQYRGRPLDEYRGELRTLIERAVAYAGGQPERVIVLSIPDWGVTPFAAEHGRDAALVGAEIDAYNVVKQAECARAEVAYIDITGLTREAATRRELLADDGLHPSAIDYQRWAQAGLPAARAAIGVLYERRSRRDQGQAELTVATRASLLPGQPAQRPLDSAYKLIFFGKTKIQSL